jgi:hypothetical protein
MGLPTAGKTILARLLTPRLNAVHFNADDVRANINRELSFLEADRIEHDRRMGWLPGREGRLLRDRGFHLSDAARTGGIFGRRRALRGMGRSDQDRALRGHQPDVHPAGARRSSGIVRGHAGILDRRGDAAAAADLRSQKPDGALGRYQPFHDGHKALIVERLKRVGQACIAVRDRQGIDEKNPFEFEYMRSRIEHGVKEFQGRFVMISVPNITNIFYGRDVDYGVERIDLDSAVEQVSATRRDRSFLTRAAQISASGEIETGGLRPAPPSSPIPSSDPASAGPPYKGPTM